MPADQVASTVYLQSSKLIDWLLCRKLLQKDYPRRLSEVQQQFKKLHESLTVDVRIVAPEVTYLCARKTIDTLQSLDNKTDFLGRSNHMIRSWRELVTSYERYNLHLAEISEAICEIASVSIPRCKNIISDRQKLITDLHQKIKEQTLNLSLKKDSLSKAYKDLRIDNNETFVKLRLLEEAALLATQFDPFIVSLTPLQKAVDLYKAMCVYMCEQNSSGKKEPFEICTTLNLLLRSGHVCLFELEHGIKPDRVDDNDDFVISLLTAERRNANRTASTQVCDSIEFNQHSDSIVWCDTDYADIDFEVVESANESPIEVKMELQATPADTKFQTNIASGKSARLLLDTVEGRTALTNDLIELKAFLTRLVETQVEVQGAEECDAELLDPSILTSAKSFIGSNAIQCNILQNAPESILCTSLKELILLLSEVDRAVSWLTDKVRNQLFTIRCKPGHLDHLVNRLTELGTQVERTKARISESQLRINEASLEQEQQASALIEYRVQCKDLVEHLEKELSKIYNRPFQIVGQVLDL